MRGQLEAAHKEISAQYDAFELSAARTSLQSLVPNLACAKIKDALRACYDVPTKALWELKAAIKAAQPERLLKYCPMCGTTLDSTFDHYIPATRFPEYAVHPLNLVPSCAVCNSTKSDDWLDAAGNRQYLHAFTDQLPDVVFLVSTLHESGEHLAVGATFDLVRPVTIDSMLWALIESHFKRLRLLARYNELSNDEIAEILSSSRYHLDDGGQDARVFLSMQAKGEEHIRGKNHWRAVLMRAMAEHSHLENWINAIRRPPL